MDQRALHSAAHLDMIALSQLDEAFASHEPQNAQQHMSVRRYAPVLAELKPRFLHHPESKRFIRAMLRRTPTSTCRVCALRRATAS